MEKNIKKKNACTYKTESLFCMAERRHNIANQLYLKKKKPEDKNQS